jgi:hypothetical protein
MQEVAKHREVVNQVILREQSYINMCSIRDGLRDMDIQT